MKENLLFQKKWLAVLCFILLNTRISAQENDGQSKSPYIRDVLAAFAFRDQVETYFGKDAIRFTLTHSLHDDVKLNPDDLKIERADIIDSVVSVYFSYLNAREKEDGGEPVVQPVPVKPGGDGFEQPDATLQNKGPNAEQFYFATHISYTDGETRLNNEDEEVRREILAMLAVTDMSFVGNGGLRLIMDFPKRFLRAGTLVQALQAKSQKGSFVSPQSGTLPLAGIFGFEEANIIYGITDWAIKTAKRQMLEAVLEKYYKALEANRICSTLLSSTLKTFHQFQMDNSVNLAKYGALWKASFQEDLRNVPVHLQDETFVGMVMDSLVPAYTGKTEMVPLISGGTKLVYGIYQKKHPVNLLAELSTEYLTSASSLNQRQPVFKRAVFLANTIANAIGGFEDGVYDLMTLQDFRNLSPAQWMSFLGLVYSRNRDELHLCFGRDVSEIVLELKARPGAKFYNLVTAAIAGYSAIQELLLQYGPRATVTGEKQLSSEQLNKMLKLSGELVSNALPYIFSKTSLDTGAVIKRIMSDWQPVSLAISQIGEGIASKEYGAVMDGTLQLLNYGNTVLAGQAGISPRATEVIKYLTKYGSFMVNVLAAKDPEAVENALDELIPKDQYKLKNTSTFGVSLSLYPGVFGGWETVKKFKGDDDILTNTTTKSTRGSFSFYLPVGIDFSVGTGNSSWILFLQALDLGSVLNYRLTGDDSTEKTNPNISFSQLLSPGVSLMHQIKNSPIVIGTGINYTPSLRKIEQAGNTYDANAFRFGFFVAVDVTAFHLSLSKKKQTPK